MKVLFKFKISYSIQFNFQTGVFSYHLVFGRYLCHSSFAKKTEPINKFSKVSELRNYSLGYLHHLFKISDPLGQRLGSLNNLEFYLDLMAHLQYGIEKEKI